MSSVAVITARAGSKRIPHKNIREFCGKPIIAYSIEAAVESGLFDEVMVSTDDEEIAEISKQYGAKIPFYRSAETSNDFATTMDVLREVVDEYRKRDRMFEYLCCIYPTAPFVTGLKIRDGYDTLKKSDADMLIPVVKFECPPQWGVVIDEGSFLRYCSPEFINIRSQDLEPLYHDAGQFYWYNVNRCFENNKDKLSTGAIVLPDMEVQDIDNESDWSLAEMKYKFLHKKK